MKTIVLNALVIFICAIANYSAAQELYPAEIETRINRVANSLLAETAFRDRFAAPATLMERLKWYQTPGVCIAVINDGEVEWVRGFGVREWGTSKEVTDTTLFQAGSISKPIFALAMMRLVQQGRLDLDTDINTYLTSWKVPLSGTWRPIITLRQILSHSAGLTVHGFPGYLRSEKRPGVVQILNGEAPANTAKIEVNIIPGIQSRYSGGGTTVAQQLVTDLLKKSFPEIMRELVLDPLGMERSTYQQPLPLEGLLAASTAHPRKYQQVTGKAHIYPEMAAAGLWTTAADLARAGLEVQRALQGKSEFLSKEIVSQMLTAQTGDNNGMGFFLRGEGDQQRFGHGGWDEGFVARMTMYKNHVMGAVIMVNSNQGNPMIAEIERAIAKEYRWPDYYPEPRKKSDVPLDSLKANIGKYITNSGFQFDVTLTAGVLYLQPSGQNRIALTPESASGFFMQDLNADISFSKDKGGKVTALTLQQSGRQTTAEKKK